VREGKEGTEECQIMQGTVARGHVACEIQHAYLLRLAMQISCAYIVHSTSGRLRYSSAMLYEVCILQALLKYMQSQKRSVVGCGGDATPLGQTNVAGLGKGGRKKVDVEVQLG
jgi:hypothetical protein